MEAIEPKNIDQLIEDLKDTSYVNKEEAAKELAKMGENAIKALDTLKEVVLQERDMITVGEFLRAIVKIEKDKTIVVKDFISYLNNSNIRFTRATAGVILDSIEIFKETEKKYQNEILKKSWEIFESNPNFDISKLIVKLEDNPKKINKYIRENFSKDFKPSTFLIGTIAENLEDKEKILEILWIEIETQNVSLGIELLYWAIVMQIGKEIAKKLLVDHKQIQFWKKLFLCSLDPSGLKLEVSNDEINSFIDITHLDIYAKYKILLNKFPEDFNSYWQQYNQQAINFILEGLKLKKTYLTTIIVAWLNEWSDQRPIDDFNKIVNELVEALKYETKNEKERRDKIIKRLQNRQNRQKELHSTPYLDNWKKNDSKLIIDDIFNIFKEDTERRYSKLFRHWVEMIIDNTQHELVESVKEELKNRHNAISPLVLLLSKDLFDVDKLKEIVIGKMIQEESSLDKFYRSGGDISNGSILKEFLAWRNKLNVDKYPNLLFFKDAEDIPKQINEEILKQMDIVINEELKARCVRVKRETSRKLAEMSDYSLTDPKDKDQQDKLKKVKEELKKHAIPVISKNLSVEKDSEIRENYTRILGHVGGREAVDVLTRAVIGNERDQIQRQNLLSEYYLNPAKKRSQDASKILKDAVDEAKKTLVILRYLNIVAFGLGILLIIVGMSVTLFSDDGWNRWAGAFTGIGGLAGIIFHFIKAPLDRIQSAMANLVQIETAFTSFIWELNLNSTFIQSQYVKEGVLNESEIKNTIERIEGAMELTMSLVSVYTDKSNTGKYSILRSLNPSIATEGSIITINGHHLKGNFQDKNDHGIVAIDHEPVDVEIEQWSDHIVKIILPDNFGNGETKIYNISLFIDGIETNSLPLKVVKKVVSNQVVK